MVMRLWWREEMLHVRFGAGAQGRPEPVVESGVGHGAPGLLPQVLIPAGNGEQPDEPPGRLACCRTIQLTAPVLLLQPIGRTACWKSSSAPGWTWYVIVTKTGPPPVGTASGVSGSAD